MNTTPHSQRYLPHEINTKFYAVKLYRTGVGVSFICRRYHISKSSLLRWNKKFDGSLYRVYRRLGYSSHAPSTKKMSKPKTYDTPIELGVKWQMDVKYVSTICYTGQVPQKFYQYTVIDEASMERFIYPYMEQSSYSTVDFLKRAILYFGYPPLILQTDNESEFTHIKKTNRKHPLDILCKQLGITHKRIHPRTPQHNGKVERSHRNDQERFYKHMSFYSYDDLKNQMKRYLNRSNNIPMQVLGWKSTLEKRHELETL